MLMMYKVNESYKAEIRRDEPNFQTRSSQVVAMITPLFSVQHHRRSKRKSNQGLSLLSD